MNKLTLDDLKRKYADRAAKPIEKPMKAAVQAPAIELTENLQAVAPVSLSNKTSTAPIVAFMVFSGMFLFVGLAVLVSYDLDSSFNSNNQSESAVLGESTTNSFVYTNTEDDSSKENPAVNARNEFIIKVIDDLIHKDKETEDSEVVVEESETVTQETVVVEEETVEEMAVQLVKVLPVSGDYVNLRKTPNGPAYTRTKEGNTFELVSEIEEAGYTWVEIRFDESTTYWIRGDLVEKL